MYLTYLALQSIGYIVFMTEGLIAAIHFRQLDGLERVKAIWSHALLQLRAVICVLIGFGVIYRNKVIATACAPGRASDYVRPSLQ